MLQKTILVLILTFIYLSNCLANEIFLSLKKSKVNVRYGPSLESPIKYVYKKINLPIKQIDKKATPRRTITATTGEPINCPNAALSEAKIGIPRPAASIIDAEKLYDMTFPLIQIQ